MNSESEFVGSTVTGLCVCVCVIGAHKNCKNILYSIRGDGCVVLVECWSKFAFNIYLIFSLRGTPLQSMFVMYIVLLSAYIREIFHSHKDPNIIV